MYQNKGCLILKKCLPPVFTIAFRAYIYALVFGSNTSYGTDSLGKAPLTPALSLLFECLECFRAFSVKFWGHYESPF